MYIYVYDISCICGDLLAAWPMLFGDVCSLRWRDAVEFDSLKSWAVQYASALELAQCDMKQSLVTAEKLTEEIP